MEVLGCVRLRQVELLKTSSRSLPFDIICAVYLLSLPCHCSLGAFEVGHMGIDVLLNLARGPFHEVAADFCPAVVHKSAATSPKGPRANVLEPGYGSNRRR